MYNISTNEPKHWSIGNNLRLSLEAADSNIADWLNHGTAEEHTTLIVGGDLYVKDNTTFKIPQYADVYVLGDCYVYNIHNMSGNLFVGGRLYATGNVANGVPICQDAGGYIHVSNPDDMDKYAEAPWGWGAMNTHIVDWDTTVSDDDVILFTKDKVVDKLNTAIGSNSYPKWTPEVDDIEWISHLIRHIKTSLIHLQVRLCRMKHMLQHQRGLYILKQTRVAQ